MSNFLNQSAMAMAEAIRCRDISAVELLKLHLARIDSVNPKLNAIVALDAERAMLHAEKLDQMLAKGLLLGPLHGVPFTLKDVYNTKGLTTTLGTLGLKNYVPTHDSTLVSRLKAAGAVLLGKTNLSELCTAAETQNLVYGVTHNPYDLERTPGGSSGGEAAIIAASGSAFGIGSDMGGSLRIPAHYCGIATIRPTVGRVAYSHDFRGRKNYGIRSGLDALLAVDGPFSRYVSDLYPLLKIISGSDGVDPYAVDIPLYDPQEIDLEQLNVVYFSHYPGYEPTSEIQNSISNVVQALRDRGATVEEKSPDFLSKTMSVMIELLISSGYDKKLQAALLACGTRQSSALLKKFLDKVERERKSHFDFQSAWENWTYFRSDVMNYCHHYDAIICPVLPFTAANIGLSLWDDALFPALAYTIAFSLANLPAATLRVGQDASGLPIGVQVVAKPWREDVALAVGEYLENEFGGWKPSRLKAENPSKS